MARDRANILIVMSDQHSKHVSACYGDPVVSTPNLDRLAAGGVLFENAYCPFPLCAPSRMAFLTGQQPSEIKMYGNGSILDSEVPTFLHALGAAGYENVLCGRMHFGGYDQRHGFRKRIFPEVSGNAAGMLGHTNAFRRASLERSGPGRNHYLLYDEECVAEGVRWLRTQSGKRDQPFCLVVGLVGPHCPFVCPPELFEKYFDSVSLPQYTEDDLSRMHGFNQRFRERSKITDATAHEIRRTRAAYYGMVEFDDRLIGMLLGTLEEAGLTDDTLVVYTSDHGEMAGEHGMWWKMSFYEGSVAVPMIVSMPGRIREGAREATPASLIDLAPTVAEMAGAPDVPGVSGASLVGYLTGEQTDPDRRVFSEMFVNNRVWTDQGPSRGPARMLRKGKWKCMYYHGEKPELYDLENDPDEMNDLAEAPEHGSTLESMLREMLTDWDPNTHIARMEECINQREIVRAAPGDPTLLRGEHWRGPEGYGYVEPNAE